MDKLSRFGFVEHKGLKLKVLNRVFKAGAAESDAVDELGNKYLLRFETFAKSGVSLFVHQVDGAHSAAETQ